MSARILKILGTSSQTPTRDRNHSGYYLRWDNIGLLIDPGEGTQRQMIFFNVSPSSITHIFISHFHGDHCLGLPGVLQRLSLAKVGHPIHLIYPESGAEFLEKLCTCSSYYDNNELVLHPITDEKELKVSDIAALKFIALDHVIDCIGFRLQESDGVTLIPELLDKYKVSPYQRGELCQRGVVQTKIGTVKLTDVSVMKRGQSFAYVSDTRYFEQLMEQILGVDLLLSETTFRDQDSALAYEYKHLTAMQVGLLAKNAGIKKLVISHFSQRYKEIGELIDETAEHFPEAIGAIDGMTVNIPKRERKLTKC